MNKKVLSHIIIIIVTLIWGLSYLSIKVVVSEINPILSAFYRFFITSVILFVILKIKYPDEKVLKEDRLKMALGGIFGVSLLFFFQNYSVLYTSASNVAILMASIPIFTLMAQKILFKEPTDAFKVIGSLLSTIGIVIIISSKEKISLFSSGTIGDLLALLSAFCWVIYTIINSRFKGKYKSITITTYEVMWGCLFLSPSLFFNQITIPSTKAILNLVFLAVFCSCIGYVLYIYCLKYLGATVIATYVNLEPIVSLVFAALILGERITIWQILGCIIIIFGVFLVSFSSKLVSKYLKQTN